MIISSKQNIAVGTLLLVLSAFFSIALILQLLDFGSFGPGHGNIFFGTGQMLYSVYGFSSVLIPIFLLAAALACFASKWTARKSMMLLTAVIPFFTSVGTEKICRIIFENFDPFKNVKIGLVLILGAMLVTIEFLAVGIIADKISNPVKDKEKKEDSEKLAEDSNSGEESAEISENNTEKSKKDIDTHEKQNEKNPQKEAPAKTAITEEIKTETTEDTAAEDKTEEVPKEQTPDPFENVFDEIESKSQSLITPEEYEALTNPIEESDVETEDDSSDSVDNDEEIEELEWPDTSEIKAMAGNPDEPEAEDFTAPEQDDELSSEETKSEQERDESGDAAAQYSVDFDPPKESDLELNKDENPYYEGLAAPENDDTDENFYAEHIAESDANPENESENPYADAEYLDSINPIITDPYEEDAKESAFLDKIAEQEQSDSESIWTDEDDAPEEENDFVEESPNGEKKNETEIKADSDTLDPDFFDIDINAETQDELENKAQEYPLNFHTSSNVFEEMKADAIREVKEEKAREMLKIAEYSENANAAISQNASESESADSPAADNDKKDFEYNLTNNENSNISKTESEHSGVIPKPPYSVPTSLLTAFKDDQYWIIDEETKADAVKLKATLNEFNIEAEIIGIKKGPVVTMFELLPAHGVKLSKIVTLQDNIALRLAASSVRIVAPIPGRAAVGIEVPNKKRSIVSFREMIEQDLPDFKSMSIPVVLGKDILGKPQLLDLVKTPHLLIAGATGAGKSVCVNSMILSILYKRSPEQVKLILIDPKIVELKLYNNIPHLLTPVITESKRAFQSLQYCLCEMERRYALLDGMGVRDITSYNKRIKERNICTEKLPYIVVIIDEFADLMATTGKELESTVARLAAMSRAVGIHLVLATQRPSIDVITGLIKANIPSRIAFMVASKMDSRIIIDQVGAEMLLGKGDMLYASAADPFPVRIQGTFVSDTDVENVVEYVKGLGEPDYIDDEIFVDDEEDSEPLLIQDGNDPLYAEALDIVIQSGKASASYIQRRLKIGYNRAARLIEEMEERGIVGPANGSKPREIIHVPT